MWALGYFRATVNYLSLQIDMVQLQQLIDVCSVNERRMKHEVQRTKQKSAKIKNGRCRTFNVPYRCDTVDQDIHANPKAAAQVIWHMSIEQGAIIIYRWYHIFETTIRC